MTTVGHSITGVAIAVLALPNQTSPRRRVITIGLFILLANLPDLPFPSWGHDRYEVSHSLFVISLILIPVAILAINSNQIENWAGGARVVVAGVAAGVSHLLLDTFYNHGKGLGMFWPFSDARLALPLPWFETLKTSLPTITSHSLKVMGIECLFYIPILGLAIALRHWVQIPSISGAGEQE